MATRIRTMATEHMRLAKGLPRDLAASLGRMIARSSLLEIRLAQTLYRLAGVDERVGRITIGNPRGSDILSRMLELAQIRGLNLSPFPWPEYKKTLDDLKTRRDIFAHSPWIYNSTADRYVLFVTAGKWPKNSATPSLSRRILPEGKEVTAKDLRFLRAEIDKAIIQAESLDRFVQLSLQAGDGASTRKST